jgi:hypothetical protein
MNTIHATITNHNDDYIPHHSFRAGDWEGFMQTVSKIASSPTHIPPHPTSASISPWLPQNITQKFLHQQTLISAKQ